MYETGDLTDREFGGLKVLWLNKKSQNGSASWLCRCTCGRLCTSGGIALVKGRRTNCGECNYGRYSVVDGHMECTLPTGGRFRIDCEDYALVAQYRWTMNAAGYFVASLGRKSNHIFLHRLIMNPPDGLYVDHTPIRRGTIGTHGRNISPASPTPPPTRRRKAGMRSDRKTGALCSRCAGAGRPPQSPPPDTASGSGAMCSTSCR